MIPKQNFEELFWFNYSYSGFNVISKVGRRVRLATSATVIARPVSKPKYIVGIKLERDSMEKPTIIVVDV